MPFSLSSAKSSCSFGSATNSTSMSNSSAASSIAAELKAWLMPATIPRSRSLVISSAGVTLNMAASSPTVVRPSILTRRRFFFTAAFFPAGGGSVLSLFTAPAAGLSFIFDFEGAASFFSARTGFSLSESGVSFFLAASSLSALPVRMAITRWASSSSSVLIWFLTSMFIPSIISINFLLVVPSSLASS